MNLGPLIFVLCLPLAAAEGKSKGLDSPDSTSSGERVDGKRVDELLKTYRRHRFAPVLQDVRRYARKRDREKEARTRALYVMIVEGSKKAVAEAMRFEKATERKDKAAAKKARAALKGALSRVFDAKLALHQMKMKSLEKELAELKSEIRFRSGKKGRLIERKLEELTENDGAWDW